MTSPDSDSDSTVFDLRRTLKADLEHGGVGELSDYLAKYPGSESIVATEWLAATKTDSATKRDHAQTEFGNGRYRLLREVGRGGQGSVYIARDETLHRDVAVKIMSGKGPITPNAVERFRREALLASKLDHPGICAVYDAGEESGVLYLVMRLVPGQTLAKVIVNSHAVSTGSGNTSLYFDLTGGKDENESLPPPVPHHEEIRPADLKAIDRLLELIEKSARALHYAHEEGVIHRDIKPANIMVTDEQEPVILDFGLARDETDDTADLSIAGEVFGTPAYMSPEQLEETVHIDLRTDIYSLGATLYEAIACRRLFEAPTRRALFDHILRVQPRKLGTLVKGISKDLEVVVHTAIEKDRDQRYQTALDFADEIGRLRRHEPILARPPGPLLRLRLWYQRDRATALAAITAACILVIGTITSMVLASMAEQERRRADTENLEYRRLADSRKLGQLRTDAQNVLWPPRESMVGPMREWIQLADQILTRLPEHQSALEELRKQGRLETEDTARSAVLKKRRGDISSELAELRKQLGRKDSDSDWDETKEKNLRRRLKELEDGLNDLSGADATPTWIFESSELEWRHDRLAELVEGLEALKAAGPFDTSGYTNVAARLANAQALPSRSIASHKDLWQSTIQEISSKPIYQGLKINPQVGLVPIGFSPEGLAEFAHIPSGQVPKRGPKGELIIDEESAIVLILIPGGKFVMGSPENEFGHQYNELQHNVNLAPYFIGKHEVTQAQWIRITGANKAHYKPGDNKLGRPGNQVITLLHPVEMVDWNDCTDFVQRIDLLLPTEARWEFACRAGSKGPFTWGDDPFCCEGRTNVGDQALALLGGAYKNLGLIRWDDGWTVHAPVNTAATNAFGLYGLHGNVSEWCLDRYSDTFPLAVELPPSGENVTAWYTSRNFRDGNFINNLSSARTAIRWRAGPTHKNVNVGLRVARNLE